MTEELFREDAYLKSCEARVIDVNERGGLVLDRTVFYPTGGGQPGDRGKLRLADGREIAIATTVYDKDAYYNTAKSQSAEVQNLIDQGRREYDTAKRKPIYQKMAELVLNEAYHVPLLYGRSYTGFTKNVQNGGQVYNGEAKWNYRNLWLG